MKQILVIHGAGRGAHEIDTKLAESLQRALGSEYQVSNPQMPSEGAPAYHLWRDEITRQLATYPDKLILVGHSLGGSVLLKYLSEEPIHNPLLGLFVAAAPFWGAPDWDVDEYKLGPDFASHLPEGLPIYLYHSHDDEVVVFSHLALYAQKLPQAIVREVDKGGHQFNNDFSEVARDIIGLKST
jgi:predicted alpha/beta hydrolase family esterase